MSPGTDSHSTGIREVKIAPLRLELRDPFALSHGTSDVRENLFLEWGWGMGEAPLVPYYDERALDASEWMRAATRLAEVRDPADPLAIDWIIQQLPEGSRAGRSALDQCLHDQAAKRLGLPLYRYLGLRSPSGLPTSFTLAIAEPEVIVQRARQSSWPVLKLKLGRGAEIETVSAVRRALPDVAIRVDANGGWTREQAIRLLPVLADLGVELVEQPLAVDDAEGWAALRGVAKIPLYADESIQTDHDLIRLAGQVDGIVVKLMKAGGIRGALRQITLARTLGLRVMLSCMIESSLGVTAAAHLASLADEVDLDGPLLIGNDPFAGVTYENAAIQLPERPGLGVLRKN